MIVIVIVSCHGCLYRHLGRHKFFVLAGSAQDAAKAVPRLINLSERHHPEGQRASGGV